MPSQSSSRASAEPEPTDPYAEVVEALALTDLQKRFFKLALARPGPVARRASAAQTQRRYYTLAC